MTTTAEVQYPEHEKLSQVDRESQAIGEFIECLDANRIELCRWQKVQDEDSAIGALMAITGVESDEPVLVDRLVPINRRIDELLAEYFGINRDQLEAEKRDMLERLRKANR